MKRVLFFTVLALFSHFAMGQEAPSVTIQVVSTTPTKVTALHKVPHPYRKNYRNSYERAVCKETYS